MSYTVRAFKGIVWSAFGNWLQLGLSLLTFIIVIRQLGAEPLGIFGAAMLVLGLADTLIGPTLTQSLEQRKTLDRAHIDATFALSFGLGLSVTVVVVALAPWIAKLLNSPNSSLVLQWVMWGLPLSCAAAIPQAVLLRELRFGEVTRVAAAAGIVGSIVGITSAVMGAGLWSLVFADFANRLVRFVGLFWMSRLVPKWPTSLAPLKELMGFNLVTLATFAISYLDTSAPRLITSIVLGPLSLGYFTFAQRLLDLLGQIVLAPMNNVMMSSVARLQDDMEGLKNLIKSIYRLSTAVAYPGFLAAVVLTPDLVSLLGQQWVPAVLTIQILLLVGLRTTTGTFNFAILRGTGRSKGPMFMLSAGLVLQLILVPIGAQFSIEGVAAMVLLRTFLTWPIGCWLVKSATGLTIREQLRTGSGALIASFVMCAVMVLMQHFLLGGLAPIARLLSAGTAGIVVYFIALLSVSKDERQLTGAVWNALRSGDRPGAMNHLRLYIEGGR